MIVPAKQFEGELWVKATDHNRAIAEEKRAKPLEWQGLTDEQIDLLLLEHDMMAQWPTQKQIRAFANAIEAKLKEKNT